MWFLVLEVPENVERGLLIALLSLDSLGIYLNFRLSSFYYTRTNQVIVSSGSYIALHP